jgi:hypothetical protein
MNMNFFRILESRRLKETETSADFRYGAEGLAPVSLIILLHHMHVRGSFGGAGTAGKTLTTSNLITSSLSRTIEHI